MSPLSLLHSFRSLQHSQWLDRDAIRVMQNDKLRRLVQHAYDHVSYYRKLFNDNGLQPQHIHSVDDLAKIPVTTKADLQAVPLRERLSNHYDLSELTAERTSGSTGQPFTAYFDADFVNTRNAMFLRALHVAGYRPGHKLFLITGGQKRSRPWLRWRYASIESPAEQLVAEFNSCRPTVLYGCTTPLRLMASHIQDAGIEIHRPRIVISTAESLDRTTRTLLEQCFGAPVYDFYGLTEMGLVAWECPVHNGYHLSEDTTIVEFLPDQDRASNRLVMTNLELDCMPLIRFQTGDLATRLQENQPCPCGRHLQRIERVEGRIVDCIRTAGNRAISPYRLTVALENIPGLGRYQVLQERIDDLTVRVENTEREKHLLAGDIRSALDPVIGPHTRIEVRYEESLKPPPGRKFRVVESHVSD